MRKQDRKVLNTSKKNRCTNVKSHIKSIESNNLNKSISDNDIGSSKPIHINVQDDSPFDKLNIYQRVTDT